MRPPPALMSPADPRLLLFSLLLLPSCDSLLGGEKPRPKTSPEAKETDTPDLGSVSAPPEPLLRSEHRLRFGGTSGERIGFALAKLSRLHALAGAIEIPEWSRRGTGAPRLTRDDDLRTSWICDPSEEQTCAIGIHFPKVAQVEVIRIYAATPEDGSTHSRPARVRLHTSKGWAEVRFSDDDRLWHIQLGEPVAIRNLSVEIIDTHGEGPVHLAELEVFGQSGTPRPPLEIELARRVVTFPSSPWRSKSRSHSARTAFIEEIDVDGHPKRLLFGTALYGHPGDRIVLVENADWTACNDRGGTYDLVDLETRVIVPLGDFGGYGARVFRHAKGLGMALGTLGVDEGSVQAAVVDKGSYEHRLANRLDRRAPEELLKEWGMHTTPLSRSDALTTDDPPAGCGSARLEDLDALQPHLAKRTKIIAEQWSACSLGGGALALMTTGGSCGRQWHVAALDTEGELLGLRSGKESNTHLRLRRIDGETLLVELWGSKDAPTLLRVDTDGPDEISIAAGFSLRPPAACRKRCDQEFDDLHQQTP